MELLTLEPEKKGLKDKGAQWNEMSDETVLLLSISENPEAFSLIVARYRDAFLRKAKTILFFLTFSQKITASFHS